MHAQQLAAVRLIDVHRWHGVGDGAVPVLHGATAGFPAGTVSLVTGAPGAGLTTLLACAAGLDTPTLGTVLVGGTELAALSAAGRALLRRRRIGYLPAAPVLFPLLTASRHIGLALRVAGLAPSRQRVEDALALVGLAEAGPYRAGELTSGARRRLALARALVVRPDVLFADELTDGLAHAEADAVLTLLHRLAGSGLTVVLAGRDPRAEAAADQVLVLAAGRLTVRSASRAPLAAAS